MSVLSIPPFATKRSPGTVQVGAGLDISGSGVLSVPAGYAGYDVRDYGAVGDGVANDQPAIQAAVEAAHAAGGGVVSLPAGTYRVAKPSGNTPCVKLYGGITLRGAGAGATTIKLAADTTVAGTAPFVYLVGNNAWSPSQPGDLHIGIEDLCIDGNAANFSTPGGGKWTGGVRLVNTRYTQISHVVVKNIFGDGTGPNEPVGYWESFAYSIEQSLDSKFTDCIVTSDDGGSTSSGFALNTSSNCQFVNCTAHDMTVTQGWALYEAVNVLFSNCAAYRNGGYGWTLDTCSDIRFVGCVAGGETDYASNDWFAAHSALGNTHSGWLLGSTTGTPCSAIDLIGCAGRYNGGSGVLLSSADRVSIVGGDYAHNGSNGIGVTSGATNVSLSPDVRHYANTSSDLALSGVPVVSTVRGSGAIFGALSPPTLTATVGTSGAVGSNLQPSTGYTYQLTVQSTSGQESAPGAGVIATTGLVAYPITLSWGYASGDHINVYRNGVLIKVTKSGDLGWVDDGSVVPTSTAVPTYNRTGRVQAASLQLVDAGLSESTSGAVLGMHYSGSGQPLLLELRTLGGGQRLTVDFFGGLYGRGGVNSFNASPLANATVGLLNLGPAGFGAAGGTNFAGSASGTFLGMNANAGYLGNFLDLQTAGVRKFAVDGTGALVAPSVVALVDSASSGKVKALDITANTSGQTGSAGWTALAVDITDTSSSTGGKESINVTVNGSQRWYVDSFGGMYGKGGTNAFSASPLANATVALLELGPAGYGASGGTNFVGSASGTVVGINANSGYAGNFLDFQVAGSSKLSVTAAGFLTAQSIDATKLTGLAPVGSIPNLNASIITAGQLALARGGTGLDTSGVIDGQVLIGQSSDHTFGLATLTAGSGVTINNAGHGITIAATGTGGTVTSVGLSAPAEMSVASTPVTGAGTLALSWASGQTANRVLASPDGTTGAVALRALVAADIPSLDAGKITSGTLALARLAGITTSQLDAAAGILGSQLDAAAAIASAQITSLAASKLTGTNTLPDGVLSTNVPLLNAANVWSNTDTFMPASTSGVPVVVKGASGQSGNLQQWQNSSGTVLNRVDKGGYGNPPGLTLFGLANPAGLATAAGAGGPGGNLAASTTYYYLLTGVDYGGKETPASTIVSFAEGGTPTQVNLTWSTYSPANAQYINVYKGTTNAVASLRFLAQVASSAVAYTDDGTVATTSQAPPAGPTLIGGLLVNGVSSLFSTASVPTANYGLLNLGAGPFDGSTTGFYTGSSSGGILAINAASGFAGQLINAQVAGVGKFTVDSSGNLSLAAAAQLAIGTLTATQTTLTIGSLSLTQSALSTSQLMSYRLTGNMTGASSAITFDSDDTTNHAMGGSSTAQTFVSILPPVKQTGTASYTGLKVNVTETSTGSGTKLIADLQVGGTSKFKVSNSGAATATDTVTATSTQNACGSFSQTGTLSSANSNSVLTAAKTCTMNTYTGGGPLLTLNDSTTDNGGVSGALIVQALANNSEILRVDNTGAITMKNSFSFIRTATPAGASTAGAGTGGSLVSGTTYYWVVTALDPFGNESAKSNEVSFAASSSNTKVTVSWSALQGAMGYYVYRSTVSGTYTSVSRYTVINATTYTDDGTGGTTASAPTSANNGSRSIVLSGTTSTASWFGEHRTATVNAGSALSLGSGPFDGASSGFFNGLSGGTILAINGAAGSTSSTVNLIHAQSRGTNRFQVRADGQTTFTVGTASGQIAIGTPSGDTGLTLWSATNYRRDLRASDTIAFLLAPNAGSQSLVGLAVRAGSTQTSNLQEWQNSSGTALLAVDQNGNFGNLGQAAGSWRGVLMAAPVQGSNPTLGGVSGSLAQNTAYYYVVTALDPFGGESVQSAERTVTTDTTHLNTNVSWTESPGAMGYRVYRSTTSGVYTSASYYFVQNNIPAVTTFNDTGAAATGTATPPTTGTAYASKISPVTGTPNYITKTPTASANYGVLNIGSGPFDGTTTSKFVGNAQGTYLAINSKYSSGGYPMFIDCQTNGSSYFSVEGSSGSITSSGSSHLFQQAASATAQRGLLSIGNAGFNSSGGTFFAGSSSGTYLAINAASSYAGNMVDFQLAGVSKFRVSAAGAITNATLGAASLTGTNTLPDGVLSTNVPLLNAANAFSAAPLKITAATPASANYGSLSVGDGPWDGSTSGFFAGTSSGACIATNPASGFAGRLLDLQVAGVNKVRIDSNGTIVHTGGYTANFAIKTSNYTVASSDHTLVANGSSITFTLLSSTGRAGFEVVIKNNNQTTTVVKTASGQTIDGTDYSSTGYALNTAYGVLRLISDGSNWYSW